MKDKHQLEAEWQQWVYAASEAREQLEYLTAADYDPDTNPDHEHWEQDVEDAEVDLNEAVRNIMRIEKELEKI